MHLHFYSSVNFQKSSMEQYSVDWREGLRERGKRWKKDGERERKRERGVNGKQKHRSHRRIGRMKATSGEH